MSDDNKTYIGTDPSRVAVWDRGPEYQGGELYITGSKPVEDVPYTAEVARALERGLIREVTPEVKEKTIDLTAVSGIGEATAKKLSDLGVHTVQELAQVDPSDLSQELSEAFNVENLAAWVQAAQEIVSGD